MKEKHVHEQDTVILTKTKQCRKSICPSLLKSPRPLSLSRGLWTPFSSLGTPDFLSICLGIDSLIPLFSFRRIMLPGKGASFSFHNYFLVLRGIVPELLRQHILLTLILRASDPGAPSNSCRRLWHF